LNVVKLEDLKIVLSEGLESGVIFEFSSVNLVVGELPLGVEVLEELFFESDGGREGRDGEKGEKEDGFHGMNGAVFKKLIQDQVLNLVLSSSSVA
jgi:hypothetical protein